MARAATERDPAALPFTWAVLLGLIIEVLLLGAGAWWLSSASHQPRPLAPLTVTLMAPPPPPAHPSIPRPKPKPKPKVRPKPQPKLHPKPRPRPRPTLHPPRPRPALPRPPTPRPAPAAARPDTPPTPRPLPPPAPPTPAVPAAPPAPPPAPPSPTLLNRFEGQVHAAVQAAVRYPAAARLMDMQGRAQVAFVYRDGHVSQVRLLHSSGFSPLDQAAIAAVQQAAYPLPPQSLAHHPLHFLIWVQFHQQSE